MGILFETNAQQCPGISLNPVAYLVSEYYSDFSMNRLGKSEAIRFQTQPPSGVIEQDKAY